MLTFRSLSVCALLTELVEHVAPVQLDFGKCDEQMRRNLHPHMAHILLPLIRLVQLIITPGCRWARALPLCALSPLLSPKLPTYWPLLSLLALQPSKRFALLFCLSILWVTVGSSFAHSLKCERQRRRRGAEELDIHNGHCTGNSLILFTVEANQILTLSN